MKKTILKTVLFASAFGVIMSCSDDDSNITTPALTVSKEAVVLNHANIVAENYSDSYNKAVTLQTKVNTFITTPTAAGLTAAIQAWLDAREPYGQTEVYRETNSPIDVEQSADTPWGIENEGQLNAWPCDEGYIDYVLAGTEAYAGTHTGGIIAGTDVINAALITGANEGGTGSPEKNVSTGWHAIEFLLWGQDNTAPIDNLAGQRPFTDYTTEANAARRKTYLKTATDLVVADLLALKNTWAVGGTYRTVFDALDTDVALAQFINGAKFIAGEELSTERMIAPVNSTAGINNSGQEDEHSCFSDNTHRDVYANAQGVFNVIYGSYGSIEGASFYQLVLQENTVQAGKLKAAADAAKITIDAIANNTKPFDLLIVEENSTDSPLGPVMQGVVALQTLGDEISASASVLGINLN